MKLHRGLYEYEGIHSVNSLYPSVVERTLVDTSLFYMICLNLAKIILEINLRDITTIFVATIDTTTNQYVNKSNSHTFNAL